MAPIRVSMLILFLVLALGFHQISRAVQTREQIQLQNTGEKV